MSVGSLVRQIAIMIRDTHAILASGGGNSFIRLVLGWRGCGSGLKLLLRIASAVAVCTGVRIVVATEALLRLSELSRLLSALLGLLGIVHVRSGLGIVHWRWHSSILLRMLKVVWMRILHRISVLTVVRLLGRLVLRLVLLVTGLVLIGLVGSIGVAEVLLVTVLTTLLVLLTLVVALLVTSLLVVPSFSGTIFGRVALCGLGLAIRSVLVATLGILGVLVRFVLLSLVVLLSTIILLVMLLLFIIAALRTHFIFIARGSMSAR